MIANKLNLMKRERLRNSHLINKVSIEFTVLPFFIDAFNSTYDTLADLNSAYKLNNFS